MVFRRSPAGVSKCQIDPALRRNEDMAAHIRSQKRDHCRIRTCLLDLPMAIYWLMSREDECPKNLDSWSGKRCGSIR
jgi:hypothetical protein